MKKKRRVLFNFSVFLFLCLIFSCIISGCTVQKEIEIKIQSPPKDEVLTSSPTELKGFVAPSYCTVKVNGDEVKVNSAGEFSKYLNLKEGDNQVVIIAKSGGQEKSRTLNLVYKPASTEPSTNKPTSAQGESYKVARVIDGDTIAIEIDGKEEKIRLIGINTPETSDPRKNVECFGQEATKKTQQLLQDKTVKLESDPTQSDRDKYGRLLRYVFLEDGKNVNEILIKEGYGYEYTYDKPYKYQESFKKAQKEAENEKRGLWADSACVKETPKEETQPTPAPKSTIPTPTQTSKCDPNYSGCVPIASDVDCEGGSGNGPAYVKGPVNVTGTDIYKLDNDGDGVACN